MCISGSSSHDRAEQNLLPYATQRCSAAVLEGINLSVILGLFSWYSHDQELMQQKFYCGHSTTKRYMNTCCSQLTLTIYYEVFYQNKSKWTISYIDVFTLTWFRSSYHKVGVSTFSNWRSAMQWKSGKKLSAGTVYAEIFARMSSSSTNYAGTLLQVLKPIENLNVHSVWAGK